MSSRPPRHRRRNVLSLLAVGALALTSCGTLGAQDRAENHGRPHVLTTFTVLEDIGKNVAGDHLEVQSITRPGAEIHEYEPTPEDVKKAADADLVLDNGLGLETWFQKFTEDSGAHHVTLSDGVESIPIAAGESAGHANPHAWMSPQATKVYVDNMVRAFSDLDPSHADDFRANAERYKKDLDGVQHDLVDRIGRLPSSHRLLMTCEGAFSYLARDAGLEERYLWAVNSDEQGTPGQIRVATDEARKRKLPAVFCESTVSPQAMRQVAEASGAKLGQTLYVDSLSEQDGPVPTYLDLIRHDARAIAEGLEQQR